MQDLDRSVRTVWMAQYLIYTAILVVICALFELPSMFSGSSLFSFLPPGVLTGIVLLIGVVWSIVVPRIRYRFWHYRVDSEEVYVEHGVFTNVKTIVPLRRVQHLDVSRNLFEREFDLGRLVIYTAGTQGNRVVIPGLKSEVAESLRDHVRSYIVADAT